MFKKQKIKKIVKIVSQNGNKTKKSQQNGGAQGRLNLTYVFVKVIRHQKSRNKNFQNYKNLYTNFAVFLNLILSENWI